MTTPRLLSNRYELGETLGYGGMSEVHHGRDVRLGREVAVKVLRADLARDPQFQERFRREAQNAAALNHPAIVAVYDTGETRTENGSLPYIVMEYVEGRTLRDIVKTEGPLPGQRAMEIMADVSAALDFSHRHGIVHRDVKPANVMITRTGAVKVMDFGIARAVADGQVAVTQTAAVIGTAQYLSPEQARGEAVDARSDVYASGCVLFELLTGEPPFTGDSPVAVAYQHVREDPKSPSSLNPRVTQQLDAIVLKAMAKGPANRYQSAAEMRTDLVRVLSGQRPAAPMVMTDEDRTTMMTAGRPAAPTGRHRPDSLSNEYDDYDDYDEEEDRRQRRKRGWLIAGALALVLVLAGVAFWLLSTGDKKEAGGDQVAVPSIKGQSQQAAREALQAKGFTNIAFTDVVCEAQADGQVGPCGPDSIDKVVGVDPAEGTQIGKAQQITVQIGRSPGKVTVPASVLGMDVTQATKTLTEAKLKVATGDPEQIDTDDPALVGKVAKTDPPGGTPVAPNTEVKLFIGKSSMVQLDNYVGQDYEAAAQNLEQAKLKATKKEAPSDRPKGEVIAQAPAAGQKVKAGSVITLTVSNGEAPSDTFKMIDLTGKTKDEAESALKARGWTGKLNVTEAPPLDPRIEDGEIFDQEQGEGQDVEKDADINVIVAKKFGGG